MEIIILFNDGNIAIIHVIKVMLVGAVRNITCHHVAEQWPKF